MVEIKRAFADTPSGLIHYRTAGRGEAVLMLHQTPRSSDEFLDVIPAFAKYFRVIAMDTIGYGDSYRPLPESTKVEDFGRAVIELLDSLGIKRAHVVGHHTGAVVAIEIAASYPARVNKLVLSAAAYVDEERRKEIQGRRSVDFVEVRPDGSHLAEMWQIRMAFYPKNRPDLLTRFVSDALKAKENIELGHHLVALYSVPEKLPKITAPTLALCGTDDPYCYPDLKKIGNGIKGSEVVGVPGGMVPLVDQMPDEFSRIVLEFLRRS
ncbi:MAG: alpha/beta hydrolase [Thaumarchaeota archaeon]|nr:alpha/beta hydrolase [Nitrososphaerota archaeon]